MGNGGIPNGGYFVTLACTTVARSASIYMVPIGRDISPSREVRLVLPFQTEIIALNYQGVMR